MRSQAWRRRKHLGGHCECFEKQAFEFIIIDLQKLQSPNYIFATQVISKTQANQTIKYASKSRVQYRLSSIHTSN